ncbi:hypothetical protein GH714_014718 [Hevea brasiliensis]|uniref:Uncharacterized protein n=1 Tax=Hevea brasiliensis TaxID=3981 RepID=A0A6A6KBW0_HEVBR|nr:hypothetical protein GH714_014718 [Hevea brasiliensis]
MGIKFDNEVLALMVLASLLESWKTFKLLLTNSALNGLVNMESIKSDQIIEDVGKVQKNILEFDDDSTNLELIPLTTMPREVGDDIQDNLADANDAPIDDEPNDEGIHIQSLAPMISPISLRRSDKARQHSTKYPSDKYALLIDGGEPKCFEEAMNYEHKLK